MSRKSELAAMQYLADKRPEKYRLNKDLGIGFYEITGIYTLEEKIPSAMGGYMWWEFHTVNLIEDE